MIDTLGPKPMLSQIMKELEREEALKPGIVEALTNTINAQREETNQMVMDKAEMLKASGVPEEIVEAFKRTYLVP